MYATLLENIVTYYTDASKLCKDSIKGNADDNRDNRKKSTKRR